MTADAGRVDGSAPSPARIAGPLLNAWSRRPMISSFGDSGLSVFHAGHCDWHRPHSVQVAMSSRPFQLKSSIEPTPSVLSSSRSSTSSRVTGLPSIISGLTAPSAFGSPGEEHVEGGHEDVQVLGVHDVDEEDQHDADVQQQPDALEVGRVLSDSPSKSLPRAVEAKAPLP